MKYLLTNEQMRRADERAIKKLHIPSLTLMERAGRALADEGERLAPTGEALCLCGGGNNGGDGFVCARLLKERGRPVDVVCIAEKYSADCKENRERWRSLGVVYTEIPDKKYALVVDCLFGTGFHGSLEGEEAALVLACNRLKKEGAKVLSADIPSGVNGNDGRVEGVAVCADVTLCIGERKIGAYLGDGIDYTGVVRRADIGIPLPEEKYPILADRSLIRSLLPTRKRNSHKGSYGRAAIVAGSEEYTGAAYLSTAACLRSGVGYTTLFVPKALLPLYALKAPEALLDYTNEGGRYAFNEERMEKLLGYSAVAYGMGMGVSKATCEGAKWLLCNYTGSLLLDADGLNSLAAYGKEELSSLLQNKKCALVITPHAKEFSRLSGLSVEEILGKSVSLATQFAEKHALTLLLKNAVTVVVGAEGVFLNGTGNSGQAKGGSGDVLSGLIAGLCAQGISMQKAALCGAYLAGKAAEIAAREVGEYALTATECIRSIGKAFLFVTEDADEGGGEE